MNESSTEYEPEEDWDFDFTTDYEAWHWYEPQPHGEHLLVYCGRVLWGRCGSPKYGIGQLGIRGVRLSSGSTSTDRI